MKAIRLLLWLSAMLLFAVPAIATEPCMATAAREFGIEANILDAIQQFQARHKARNPAFAAKEHGPMGVSNATIKFAAKHAKIDPEKAKTIACENYRVAAWFLSDTKHHLGVDTWGAVRVYFFGTKPARDSDGRARAWMDELKQLAGA